MSKKIVSILTALLILLLMVPQAEARKLKKHRISHQFKIRNFYVYRPPKVTKQQQLPVIIALHGGGGNAKQFAKSFPLIELANKEKVMIVYPDGHGRPFSRAKVWNQDVKFTSLSDASIDDVGFIKQLIERLIQYHGADPKRIYLTGHSNGAGMVYRTACQLSDQIAAIAPMGINYDLTDCRPKRAVPIIHFHGKLDSCANYHGSERCGGCYARVFQTMGINLPDNVKTCEPLETELKKLQKEYQCIPQSQTIFERQTAVCQNWTGCRDQGNIVFCTDTALGHAIAGQTAENMHFCRKKPDSKLCQAYKEEVGPFSSALPVRDLMWSFFNQYRLK